MTRDEAPDLGHEGRPRAQGPSGSRDRHPGIGAVVRCPLNEEERHHGEDREPRVSREPPPRGGVAQPQCGKMEKRRGADEGEEERRGDVTGVPDIEGPADRENGAGKAESAECRGPFSAETGEPRSEGREADQRRRAEESAPDFRPRPPGKQERRRGQAQKSQTRP